MDIYEARRNSFKKQLEAHGIIKALLTNPSDILYFIGVRFTPYERFFGLVIGQGSNTDHLLVPKLEKGKVNSALVGEVTYDDSEDPFVHLAEIIGDSRCVGIQKKHLSSYALEKISALSEQKYSSAFEEIGDLIEAMRLHKDAYEIEMLLEAGKYADKILAQVSTKLKPGISEKQAKFELLRATYLEQGVMGEAFDFQVSSGIHSANPHGVTDDKEIQLGEPIVIDFGVIYNHYRSDISRTFFVGTPTAELEKIYGIVLEAQKAAIERVKPGVPVKDIDLAARDIITEAGYGQYFLNRTGHGLGLDVHEPISIHDKSEHLLEEGMVFTVEPGIYIPGLGGVRIEDDIAVTKDGRIVLTRYPKELEDMIIYL